MRPNARDEEGAASWRNWQSGSWQPLYIGKVAHKGKLYDGIHEALIDQEAWNRCRELLRENAVKRRRSKNLPSGRMLHGKLANEDGRLYSVHRGAP